MDPSTESDADLFCRVSTVCPAVSRADIGNLHAQSQAGTVFGCVDLATCRSPRAADAVGRTRWRPRTSRQWPEHRLRAIRADQLHPDQCGLARDRPLFPVMPTALECLRQTNLGLRCGQRHDDLCPCHRLRSAPYCRHSTVSFAPARRHAGAVVVAIDARAKTVRGRVAAERAPADRSPDAAPPQFENTERTRGNL